MQPASCHVWLSLSDINAGPSGCAMCAAACIDHLQADRLVGNFACVDEPSCQCKPVFTHCLKPSTMEVTICIACICLNASMLRSAAIASGGHNHRRCRVCSYSLYSKPFHVKQPYIMLWGRSGLMQSQTDRPCASCCKTMTVISSLCSTTAESKSGCRSIQFPLR